MLEQIDYLSSWIEVKLAPRLGQRGAEMVEYAIVLAVVAVLGAWFYGNDAPNNSGNSEAKQKTFTKVLSKFWTFIGQKIGSL